MAGSGMSLRDISDVAIDINTVVDESVLTFDSADKKFKARKLVASDVPVKALTDYANVVVVDAGGNGDHLTLGAALAAITDADPASNPYQILIAPGIYTESGDVALKSGVNVSPIGPGSVEIRLADSKSVVLSGTWAGMTEIMGIRFRCMTNTSPILMTASGTPYVRFTHCRFTADDVQNVTTAIMTLNHSAGAIEMHHCRIESLLDVAFSSVQIYLRVS